MVVEPSYWIIYTMLNSSGRPVKRPLQGPKELSSDMFRSSNEGSKILKWIQITRTWVPTSVYDFKRNHDKLFWAMARNGNFCFLLFLHSDWKPHCWHPRPMHRCPSTIPVTLKSAERRRNLSYKSPKEFKSYLFFGSLHAWEHCHPESKLIRKISHQWIHRKSANSGNQHLMGGRF